MEMKSSLLLAILLIPSLGFAAPKPIPAAGKAGRSVTTTIATNSTTSALAIGGSSAPAGAIVPPTAELEANDTPEILNFQQWRQEKIKEASLRLDEIKKDQSTTAASSQDESSQSRQYQAQWALETAQELEVTDYLLLYLSAFVGTKKFEEAAARLNKNEIAVVMEKYISAVQKGPRARGLDSKTANQRRAPINRPAQAFSN